MKKMFGTVLLGALLASSALASSDFLARVSQGALSDKSEGVKVLSLDEMKEARGGYVVRAYLIAEDEYLAVAIPNGTTTRGQAVSIYSVTGDDTLKKSFWDIRLKEILDTQETGRMHTLRGSYGG